jgi:predicted Zn-dependent protease
MSAQSQDLRALAARAVELAKADEVEAMAAGGTSALTRFADNRIHQNVAETDTAISVRAIVGTRTGVAATNRTDDDSLKECCQAAVRAAKAAPEDPDFPGLPGPAEYESAQRVALATRGFDAQLRAASARSIVEPSSSRGLSAAGQVSAADQTIAIANSRGVNALMPMTTARATVLSAGPTGGSGWASFASTDVGELVPSGLGEIAANIAELSAEPDNLEPGDYTVVLTPEAVSDLVGFLAYVGFSAKAHAEDRSFMSGKIGERIMSPMVTIVDDAIADNAIGLTFDFEGQPKKRVDLIKEGVANAVVTDSYWAAKTDSENTGHALPAPNAHGPMPLNLRMEPGNATIDELVSSVRRGIYVTRFHYVNVEEPIPVTLTGMTRDGTFLIEDGQLSRPLKNQRFTQSVIEAFSNVRGITTERQYSGSEFLGHAFVPGMLLESFTFTGQTG